MDEQLIAVAVVIVGAAAYLLRSSVKTWFGSRSSCASGCGKCVAPAAEPASRRITLPRI